VNTRYTRDEIKRESNLAKHGLDFKDAGWVLDSPFRLDIESLRNGEARIQSFAYVFEKLTVLTVVYVPGARVRIISFRPASRVEREIYHDWLENDFIDP
jgi:uncharacterized DUF497 family protein